MKPDAPRVLIVDDEPAVLTLVDRVLRTAGYETRTAAGAADALVLADNEGPYDLLLTDVAMPNTEGCELARRMHQRHPTTKVMYLTAYVHKLLTARMRADEDYDDIVLEKPITNQALLDGVSLGLFGHTRGLEP